MHNNHICELCLQPLTVREITESRSRCTSTELCEMNQCMSSLGMRLGERSTYTLWVNGKMVYA